MIFLAVILNCVYFYYDRLIGIFFLAVILNLNFRLLYSNFFIGLLLYLRRWPNIKTTLCRRFVFDGITTVSSIFKL